MARGYRVAAFGTTYITSAGGLGSLGGAGVLFYNSLTRYKIHIRITSEIIRHTPGAPHIDNAEGRAASTHWEDILNHYSPPVFGYFFLSR